MGKRTKDVRPRRTNTVSTFKLSKGTGKYDHLFEEPVSQGKYYNEYKKNNDFTF